MSKAEEFRQSVEAVCWSINPRPNKEKAFMDLARTWTQAAVSALRQFKREWASAQKAKLAWALKREGRSLARDHDDFNDTGDNIMREELAKYHADKRRSRGRGNNDAV
jgi:hypothetical protein